MAAGARLAAERDRWPAQWRVADLEYEEDRLLDMLEGGEELCAAVPGVLTGDGSPAVLIGVTERRVLLLARTVGDTVAVTDATACVATINRSGPIPFGGREIMVDVEADELARLWAHVDEIGRRADQS